MPGEQAASLPSTDVSDPPTQDEKISLAHLEDALHELSQPLTALSMVLDMASFRTDADGWREALATARTECRRAVVALHAVRSVAFPSDLSALRSAGHQGKQIS
ncbi:MAG: hypothetical protein ACRYF4_10170 [Janthinobacterium lividum]